jgi:type IV secretion system protein VirD4
MSSILLGWQQRDTRARVGFIRSEPARPAAPGVDEPVADASEAHCLVVAPTGAGKGRNVVIPNLLHWPHTAIVVDVKGEAAMATARYRRSLGQRVVVLDPFCRVSNGQDGLNPLDWLATTPECVADNASTLSETLTGGERSLKDPFWDHLANDFAAGLLAYAATSENPCERQISHVFDIVAGDDPVMHVARILDTTQRLHPFARQQLASFLSHEAEKVRTSVRSTAQQHLRIFGNPLVCRAMSKTTIDLAALSRGEPMTIFIVLPASRLQSHASVLRIWLAVLLGVISERSSRPLQPGLLIIDELAQIGAMPLVLQALTLLRGYGLRVMAVLQSLAQLKSLWPADYQTILDNCGLVAAFGQNRPAMAEALADLFGDLSASALLQMPADQLAINRAGQRTVVARKLDYLEDRCFAGRFDANPFYEHKAPD